MREHVHAYMTLIRSNVVTAVTRVSGYGFRPHFARTRLTDVVSILIIPAHIIIIIII